MRTTLLLFLGLPAASFAGAQAMLYDFDIATPTASLPVTRSATGQGFSPGGMGNW
jgi:hypothetical protein